MKRWAFLTRQGDDVFSRAPLVVRVVVAARSRAAAERKLAERLAPGWRALLPGSPSTHPVGEYYRQEGRWLPYNPPPESSHASQTSQTRQHPPPPPAGRAALTADSPGVGTVAGVCEGTQEGSPGQGSRGEAEDQLDLFAPGIQLRLPGAWRRS